MITIHDDIEQGSDAWHEARKDKFTGSNAYKLLSSFGAGDHAKSVTSDFKGNFHTKRGHLLESEAIELYEQISGQTVQTCGFVTNDAYPNALYSPDGLTDSHVIEVKCFSEAPHLAIYKAEDWMSVPVKILAQIYFGMMICEKQAARLIIYNPRLDTQRAFRYIDIPHNPNIEARLGKILHDAGQPIIEGVLSNG